MIDWKSTRIQGFVACLSMAVLMFTWSCVKAVMRNVRPDLPLFERAIWAGSGPTGVVAWVVFVVAGFVWLLHRKD